MAFDGIAVSVIAKELATRLQNARVMKIYQADKHSVVLHLRLPGESTKLLISAHPTQPRIHTTTEDWKNPLNPPAFCMLLRKHLEPSRLLGVRQHELERLMLIRFETYDERMGLTEKTLIFELMGRHSNLILVNQDNTILDGIHRVSAEQSSVRIVMPGEVFTYPPNQGKTNPLTVTNEQFITDIRLLPANVTLSKGLQQLYQGLGPETAREVVRRAALDGLKAKQDATPKDWQTLWESFEEFLTMSQTPVIVERENGKLEFYAYTLTNHPQQKSYADFDSLLNDFYSSRIKNERVQQKANELQKGLKTLLARLLRKEEVLLATLEAAENAKQWQKLGELVTSNIYQIKKGDKQLEVVDYYEESQPVITIPLDLAFSPSENAQRYYKKYIKARNSKKFVQEQLQKTISERNYIAEVLVHIELADSLETIDEIRDELIRLDYVKQRGKPSKKSKTIKNKGYDEYLSADGIPMYVGRNNRQNDELTFKVAKPSDTWLHSQKIPGSHVIIRFDGAVPSKTLEEAATLAAYYSKARTSPKVFVDYTERRHVRKPNGSKPGFVIYESFSTILVNPTDDTTLPKKKRP